MPDDRTDCGWPGINVSTCEGRGCCYDDTDANAAWCFYGTGKYKVLKHWEKEIHKKLNKVKDLSHVMLSQPIFLNTCNVLQKVCHREFSACLFCLWPISCTLLTPERLLQSQKGFLRRDFVIISFYLIFLKKLSLFFHQGHPQTERLINGFSPP